MLIQRCGHPLTAHGGRFFEDARSDGGMRKIGFGDRRYRSGDPRQFPTSAALLPS